MKLIIASLLITMAICLKAQELKVSSYFEQTHISPKLGTSVGFEFRDKIEVGGFFQRASVMAEAEYGRPLQSENEFYGAFFAYPLLGNKYTNIKVNVRTGVSNGENFVITPSILADFRPLKNISIGGGIGTRAFRPTYMASIRINVLPASRGSNFLAFNN